MLNCCKPYMSMKNRCNASLDQISSGSMTFNIWSGMIALILQSIFNMIQSNNSSLTMPIHIPIVYAFLNSKDFSQHFAYINILLFQMQMVELHISCKCMTKGLWSIFWGRKEIIFRNAHKSIYRRVKRLMTCILCSSVLLSEGISLFNYCKNYSNEFSVSTSYIPRI